MSDVRELGGSERTLAAPRLPARPIIIGSALGAAVLVITLLTFLLGKDTKAAILVLDYSTDTVFPYPFTIQNAMHVAFFWALGELFIRRQAATFEMSFLGRRFLPEDDETVLQGHDLGAIRRRVAGQSDGDNGFLPSLIDIAILQFQTSRSVDQMVNVLNSSLELISHRVDLRYQVLRYLAWLIPTVGFIGTVVGIAGALGAIDPDNPSLAGVTGSLAVAFNTTIIALVESAVIVLGIHLVQTKEERSVNLAGTYCLRNLINRMYAGH